MQGAVAVGIAEVEAELGVSPAVVSDVEVSGVVVDPSDGDEDSPEIVLVAETSESDVVSDVATLPSLEMDVSPEMEASLAEDSVEAEDVSTRVEEASLVSALEMSV